MNAQTSPASRNRLGQPFLLLAWVVLMAGLFAQAEIQIEGADGWASSLPTWRIDTTSHVQWMFGGRQITGYHVFIFTFMFAAFHFPIAVSGGITLRQELRILGSLSIFWIVEDVLWFAMNPAYGLGRLAPEHVSWHPHWLLGLPADYFVFSALGSGLLWWSFRRSQDSGRNAPDAGSRPETGASS